MIIYHNPVHEIAEQKKEIIKDQKKLFKKSPSIEEHFSEKEINLGNNMK